MKRLYLPLAVALCLGGCATRRSQVHTEAHDSTAVHTLRTFSIDSTSLVAVVRLDSPRLVLRSAEAPPVLTARSATMAIAATRLTEHHAAATDSAATHHSEAAKTAQTQAGPRAPAWPWLLLAGAVGVYSALRHARRRRC